MLLPHSSLYMLYMCMLYMLCMFPLVQRSVSYKTLYMPYIRTMLCCYHMHHYTCYICVWCIGCTCFLLFSDPPARIKIYNFAGSLTRGLVKTCMEIPFQSTKKALTSASPECTMEPPERSTCGPRCVLSGAHDDCRPKVESHE